MKKKEEASTYVQALNNYFGGVSGLAQQSLPFKCKCGSTRYPNKLGESVDMMNIGDCFLHIRRIHKERIKRTKKVKLEQTSIL